jgi:hypothetical protein
MTDNRTHDTPLLAAGSSCPMPDCGALAVSYRPAGEDSATAGLWEFTCPHCGFEFAAFDEDLLFRSVQEEWFRAGIHSA